MFTKQEMKQNLAGSLEIMIFMRRGIERFKNVSRADAIKSFAIPVAFLPLVFTILILTSKEGHSIPFLLSVHFSRMVIGALIYLAIVYFLSKQLERQEHFYKFLVIINWTSFFDVILVSPIIFYVLTGGNPEDVEVFAVFMTLLGYVYLAFILTHTFRVPWEMGGFVAIIGLAVDQTMWDMIAFLDLTVIHGT
mgnify:FL=1|tara:strand:- start:1013 stop:1591 length:579 start_codon:yes stop_codon:yes gene_type:complete